MVHGFPADFSWNQLNQCNECEHLMSFKMKPGPPQIPGIARESSK